MRNFAFRQMLSAKAQVRMHWLVCTCMQSVEYRYHAHQGLLRVLGFLKLTGKAVDRLGMGTSWPDPFICTQVTCCSPFRKSNYTWKGRNSVRNVCLTLQCWDPPLLKEKNCFQEQNTIDKGGKNIFARVASHASVFFAHKLKKDNWIHWSMNSYCLFRGALTENACIHVDPFWPALFVLKKKNFWKTII